MERESRDERSVAGGETPADAPARPRQRSAANAGFANGSFIPAWENLRFEEGIDERLAVAVKEAGHAIHVLYGRRGGQSRVLTLLHACGPLTQRELTKMLGVKPASASEVLAKVEAAGLVERAVCERDRRTMTVSLTEAGEAEALRALERVQESYRGLFSCLDDVEKETLLALLDKLNRYRAEREDAASEGGEGAPSAPASGSPLRPTPVAHRTWLATKHDGAFRKGKQG